MKDEDFYKMLNRPPPRPPWGQQHPYLLAVLMGILIGAPIGVLAGLLSRWFAAV